MKYHHSFTGAIALAIACWALATWMAMEKAISDGVQSWAVLLAYPVLALAVGVLIHLGLEGFRTLRPLRGTAALGLALLALAVTLAASIGSTGAAKDTAIATAAKSQADLDKIRDDLAKTERLVDEAQRWVAAECRTGNGPKCEGSTFVLEQRQRSLESLRSDLKASRPEAPGTSGETRIAWVAGLAGYQVTAADVALVWPMLTPLALELLSAFFLSLAFGLKRQEEAQAVKPAAQDTTKDTAQTSFDVSRLAALPSPVYFSPEILPAPEPSPPKPRKSRSKRKDRVLEAIRAHTLKHGAPPAFSVVQSRHKLPKVTAHRYLEEVKREMAS